MRAALRGVAAVLIAAGCLLIVDAGLTLAWQEPVSALYARLQQHRLRGDLRALERRAPDPAERRALAALGSSSRRIAFLARRLSARARPGEPLGRLEIRRMGLDTVFVEGTAGEDLRSGPGHYVRTALPGAPGTVGLAGHRTTYLAPFRRLDHLRPGDPIVVRLPYGRFTYLVESTRIVSPAAVSVLRPVRYPRLVLSACHPLYSAAQRIVVFARLRVTQPLGSALEG